MDSEDKKQPASPETIKSLTVNMLQTMESTYHEMYVDMVLMAALRQGILDNMECVDRDYIEKVIRVHANICYAVFSLCVQCRASLKSSLNVEKQYNIRRSVVTGHEMYKYLYGFSSNVGYFIIANFVNYLLNVNKKTKGADGILYPSVPAGGAGFNVAIKPTVVDERIKFVGAGLCHLLKKETQSYLHVMKQSVSVENGVIIYEDKNMNDAEKKMYQSYAEGLKFRN